MNFGAVSKSARSAKNGQFDLDGFQNSTEWWSCRRALDPWYPKGLTKNMTSTKAIQFLFSMKLANVKNSLNSCSHHRYDRGLLHAR